MATMYEVCLYTVGKCEEWINTVNPKTAWHVAYRHMRTSHYGIIPLYKAVEILNAETAEVLYSMRYVKEGDTPMYNLTIHRYADDADSEICKVFFALWD